MPDKRDNSPEKEDEEIRVFQYNDEIEEFQELEFEEDVALPDLLDSDFNLLFIDPRRYRAWLWHGNNTTTKMKFNSARIAPRLLEDLNKFFYKITAVNEGDETLAFKIVIGIEKEIDYETIQKEPLYKETEEELELLELESREKILLTLEKAGLPEGFERKMVIVKNTLYGYEEYERDYMGNTIIEKELVPLENDLEDGSYLAKGYIPRILLSFNNVVLIELLVRKDVDAKILKESDLTKEKENSDKKEDKWA